MRSTVFMRMAVLAMGFLLLAAVVHASTDFDSCLLYGTAHRSASHNSHVCQVCNLNSWDAGPDCPTVAPLRTAAVLEWQQTNQPRSIARREVSVPRAPPAFLAQ